MGSSCIRLTGSPASRWGLRALSLTLIGCGSAATTARVEVYTPAQPPAQFYNGSPGELPASNALFDAVTARLTDAARETGRPVPRADARLFQVAADLARVIDLERSFPATPLAFAFHHYGLVEPTPRLITVFADRRDPAAAAERFRERLRTMFADHEFHRYGIGTSPRQDGLDATVLILQESFLETAPIPRRLAAGGTVELTGQLSPGYLEPSLVITRDDGATSRPQVNSGREGRFASLLSCPDRVGQQQVEVMADSHLGPTVLANFPVWCGVELPTSVSYEVHAAGAEARDPAAAARRLLELLNQERARAELPPLAEHPQVAEVARAYSEEMAQTGIVAHTSAVSGDLAERLRTAGIKTSLAKENLARAANPAEAHQGLMKSPAHREAILSAAATHVGIGVVVAEITASAAQPSADPAPTTAASSKRSELFVTQLFIRIPPELDPDEAADAIAARVMKVSALKRHDDLDEVAMQHARAVTGGSSLEKAIGEAIDAVKAKKLPFTRIKSLVSVDGVLDGFDASRTTKDERMTHFGVGVDQGSHPDLGDNAIYVVVLMAQMGGE